MEPDQIASLCSQITFPAIIKPRLSSVVNFSHDLVIVESKEVLVERVLEDPQFDYLKNDTMIVQEFVLDHFETLYKVYAIGEKYDILSKPTFPKQAVLSAFEKDGYLKIG
jgi:predicted ATP-grasp superfamily ATP-dependent carboligase